MYLLNFFTSKRKGCDSMCVFLFIQVTLPRDEVMSYCIVRLKVHAIQMAYKIPDEHIYHFF